MRPQFEHSLLPGHYFLVRTRKAYVELNFYEARQFFISVVRFKRKSKVGIKSCGGKLQYQNSKKTSEEVG